MLGAARRASIIQPRGSILSKRGTIDSDLVSDSGQTQYIQKQSLKQLEENKMLKELQIKN